MSWSVNFGRLFGTSIRIHLTFVILLAWIWLESYFRAGLDEASRTLIYVVLVFACVLAHEFGHILTARAFGIATPDVTLFPFGGVARLATIPEAPRQEFLITAAGPAVNVVIAGVLILFGGITVDPQKVVALTDGQMDLVTKLAMTNLLLAVFNLIPAFPMDGGRLLRAALAVPLGFPRATQLAARIGQWIAFAMGFAGLFGNPMLIVIAIFIYFAAASESQATAVRSFSAGIPLRRAMMTEFATLPTDAPVATAVETFLRTSQRAIPVVDTAGRIAGIVEIGDVVRAVQEPSSAPQISDVMTKDIPTIGQDAELGDAFRILQEKSAPAVAVVDRTSRLVGLVTLETLGEMLLLHEASPTVFDGFHVQPWGSAPRG